MAAVATVRRAAEKGRCSLIVAFILTMPNNNAWNGRWSGEGRTYAVLKTFRDTKKTEARLAPLLAQRHFYYNFGDGWGANVAMRQVERGEAQRLRRKSAGFCGYNWMIDSILDWGKIGNDLHQREWAAERSAKLKQSIDDLKKQGDELIDSLKSL